MITRHNPRRTLDFLPVGLVPRTELSTNREEEDDVIILQSKLKIMGCNRKQLKQELETVNTRTDQL
jgi:hypothetical protein